MRAVALAVTLSLVAIQTGCFPDNPKARTISKITEGVLLATGVTMEAVSNSGDCTVPLAGQPDSGCNNNTGTLATVGIVLVLAGICGFIATISTTPDEDAHKANQEIKAPLPPPPAPIAPVPARPAAMPTPAGS